MSSVVLAALLGWLIALAIFLGFIAVLRYIDHRERMALIARGIDPNRLRRPRRGTGVLRSCGRGRTSASTSRFLPACRDAMPRPQREKRAANTVRSAV